jgi:ankyrin repeat protein
MYEDFCKDDEEIYQFELDMENRRYEKWVLQYPEHTLSIFGSLLTFNRNHVKAEDICYFVSAGVDLNKVSDVFPCEYGETTALIYACEHRFENLIQYLIKYGADVNLRDSYMCPLESMFKGHNPYSLENITETEYCAKILLENGASMQHKSISDDEFDYIYKYYMENSEYLNKVISEIKFDL